MAFPPGVGVTPTPDDGTRLSELRPWDDSSRPTGPAPDVTRTYTDRELATGRHLVEVHDGLRAELATLRDLVEQVRGGTTDAAAARSHLNAMTMRQNNWTLGAYCASYCRIVATHHTIEDRGMFPHLRSSDPQLVPVIDRLAEEHHAIQGMLDSIDLALVALVGSPGALNGVRVAVDLLADALLSHLTYEEDELVEPLSRHGFY